MARMKGREIIVCRCVLFSSFLDGVVFASLLFSRRWEVTVCRSVVYFSFS